jgi:hypothetical protein
LFHPAGTRGSEEPLVDRGRVWRTWRPSRQEGSQERRRVQEMNNELKDETGCLE